MKNTQRIHHNTVKEYRLKSGLTQRSISRQMGFNSEERISRWEQGQSLPSLANLLKLAKILGVDPEDLYPDIPSK